MITNLLILFFVLTVEMVLIGKSNVPSRIILGGSSTVLASEGVLLLLQGVALQLQFTSLAQSSISWFSVIETIKLAVKEKSIGEVVNEVIFTTISRMFERTLKFANKVIKSQGGTLINPIYNMAMYLTRSFINLSNSASQFLSTLANCNKPLCNEKQFNTSQIVVNISKNQCLISTEQGYRVSQQSVSKLIKKHFALINQDSISTSLPVHSVMGTHTTTHFLPEATFSTNYSCALPQFHSPIFTRT